METFHQKRSVSVQLLAALCIVLALSAAALAYQAWQNKLSADLAISKQAELERQADSLRNQFSKKPSASPLASPSVSSTPAISDTKTLIYMETTGEEPGPNRSYSIAKIFRKVGDQAPELLTQVGNATAKEYANGFVVTPDKKALLINLESSLKVYNLETKQLRTLFTPKQQVLGTAFSPDGKSVFVWDQYYAPTDGNTAYGVHIVDLATGKSQTIKSGRSDKPYFPQAWRSDNIVILSISAGEISYTAYFDISSKALKEVPDKLGFRSINKTGTVMTSNFDSVEDICNDFSGSSFSTQKVYEPVHATLIGQVGNPEKRVNVLAIAPDGNDILYSEQTPWKNQSDCSKTPTTSYFTSHADGKDVQPVSDIDAVLAGWGLNTAHIIRKTKGSEIQVGGKAVVSSSQEFQAAEIL